MAILPNAEAAQLDLRKLRDYCLSTESLRGSHKARVFRSALQITADDAEWLGEEILRQLPFREAVAGLADRHGSRFRVDLPIARHGREAMIRTAWIIAPNSERPRFLSCRVL